ncbi:hypothetical protein INR49_017739 [Caranx melampygus]|nr:hypothetical protein INR49_017739 [Caranx melampygus]
MNHLNRSSASAACDLFPSSSTLCTHKSVTCRDAERLRHFNASRSPSVSTCMERRGRCLKVSGNTFIYLDLSFSVIRRAPHIKTEGKFNDVFLKRQIGFFSLSLLAARNGFGLCAKKQTDSEQTDFAFDGEMTATESEADEDSEMRTQVHWARFMALLSASHHHHHHHHHQMH